MKKYKLIKEYPNSGKLGVVARANSFAEQLYYNKYSEFWEEMIEIPEYVKCIKDVGWCVIGKVYKTRPRCDSFEWLYEENNCVNIAGLPSAYGKWDFFGEYEKTMTRFIPSTKEEYDKQNRKPIFTTEDGVEMFEDDNYWYVLKDQSSGGDDPTKGVAHLTLERQPQFIRFSTEGKAQEYIDKNKPKFSEQQILEAIYKMSYIAMLVYDGRTALTNAISRDDLIKELGL